MAEELEFGPGGRLDRARLRVVPPGHMVDIGGPLAARIEEANRVGRGLPEFTQLPQLSARTNWITSAWWHNNTGTPVTYFRTQWEVPPAPCTDVGQLVYLFNGMQPAKSAPLQTILQPVLEWGEVKGWSVASWVFPGPDHHTHTSWRVPVDEGDTLVGVIRLCDQSGCRFTYSCEFEDMPETRLCVCNMPELIWCVETLEACQRGVPHDLASRSEYPDADKTVFHRIMVRAEAPVGPLQWLTRDYPPLKYGQHTEIVNESPTHGRVDIYYGDEPESDSTQEDEGD